MDGNITCNSDGYCCYKYLSGTFCGCNFIGDCEYQCPKRIQYIYPMYQTCEHDFVEEGNTTYDNPPGTNGNCGTSRKWRCRKCLEVRYTND